MKGDGKEKAEDVRRQYVLLNKDAFRGVKADTGVAYWKDGKDIAGDRCASWMDGRFLQGTFNGKLKPNDERPDVRCGGEGGVSTLRSLDDEILLGLGDGSVRMISAKADHVHDLEQRPRPGRRQSRSARTGEIRSRSTSHAQATATRLHAVPAAHGAGDPGVRLFAVHAGHRQARADAKRAEQLNNLKQIVLSMHNYNDANGLLPPGVDANNFSAASKLLPYIEHGQVYQKINYTKPITDPVNAEARKTVIPTFLSPRDPLKKVRDDSGATNYLFNDFVFFRNSKSTIPASFPDGLSNTIAVGETLKGDGSEKAEDVRRQYVLLKKDELKGVKPDAGVGYWKDGKDIAGDRCASWMDGRFLQGTFNGKLKPNDERPDVSCGGEGGVSTLRSLDDHIAVGLGDGSGRFINAKKLSFKTWTNALCPNDGNVLGPDW